MKMCLMRLISHFFKMFYSYYYIIMHATYWELIIQPLDLDFIERVSDILDIDYYEADVYIGETKHPYIDITNQVISYVLTEGVNKHVTNPDDQEKLLDSIYVNALDSGYDIEPDELTEDGQAYLKLFNSY